MKNKRQSEILKIIEERNIDTQEELRNRLVNRGTETADVIEKRVSEAAHEISFAYKYDYVIVNDVLETAIDDFNSAVRAEELRTENQKNIIDEVLKNA